MSLLQNRVNLIGHLGADPELFTFKDDKSKASFSLATSNTYKKENGEKVSETQWHNIIAWGNVSKIADKYLKKGSKVAVEGKLTSRSWDDKDGNKKYITEVIIHDILMLDTAKS